MSVVDYFFEDFVKKYKINGILYNNHLVGNKNGNDYSNENILIFAESEPCEEIYLELNKLINYEKEVEKQRDLFLANISHELRNPLNCILGNIELINQNALTDENKEFFFTINSSSQQLQYIIEDILDYSKIKNGKINITEESVNLHQLFEEIHLVLDKRIREKGLKYRFTIDRDISNWINLDPKRIKQILNNLISNSIKFTDHGEINIKVSLLNKDYFQIMVEDTGVGIQESKKKLLFESFVQFNDQLNRKYDGSGLGLFICKNLIELMNGKISLESQEGVGTKVFLKIPYKPCLIEYIDENIKLLQKKSALIISDEIELRETVIGNILGWKMMPFVAINDQEIDMYLESGITFDFFIVDQNKNINYILEKIKQFDESNKIIILSDPKINNISDYYKIYKPIRKTVLFDILFKSLNNHQIEDIEPEKNINVKDLKFLVADDAVNSQKLLVNYLKKLGFSIENIFTALNGKQVLEILSKERIDYLLLDIRMPEMDGYETTTEILKRFDKKDRPIIIAVTAMSSEDESDKCFKIGMNDFLLKPVKIEAFERILKKYIKF